MYRGNILVSSARSGTNYFLAVYSKIFLDDVVVKEIFRPAGDSLHVLTSLLYLSEAEIIHLISNDPLKLWTRILGVADKVGVRALAKIFYYHVDYNNPLWSHFRDHDRVIHLVRRNPFNIFLSHNVAKQTGRWQQHKHTDLLSSECVPIKIDKLELREFIFRHGEYVDRTRNFFKGADMVEIFYEDIADGTGVCARAIADIFGVRFNSDDISVGLRKQKSKKNCELVSNYDDVADLDVMMY